MRFTCQLILLLHTLYISCGHRQQVVIGSTIHPTIQTQLADRLSKLDSHLLTCDGGPTDALTHTISGRPNCDTGDSILPLGSVSTVKHIDTFDQYLSDSIGEDGRPYRSPEHHKQCDGGGLTLLTSEILLNRGVTIVLTNQENPSCSFSRDHMLGHMLYAISTKNASHLLRILGYMNNNHNYFCPGSLAQCGMSLASWDAFNTTLTYLGIPSPNFIPIPTKAAYLGELLTTLTNESFQLSLIANIIYIKILTNTYTTDYNLILDKLVEKAPYNTFFKYLKNVTSTNSNEINTNLAIELIKYIDVFLEKGSNQTVWYWSWDEIENANAWSFLFMGELLLIDLSK